MPRYVTAEEQEAMDLPADEYLVRRVRDDYAAGQIDDVELERRLEYAARGQVPLDMQGLPLYADPELFSSPFDDPPMEVSLR